MTPEEFLKDLAAQIGPAFKQTHENLLIINANFEAMGRDIQALMDIAKVQLKTAQEQLETTRSHERRLGLLEKEAPTAPIRKGTGTEGHRG